MKLVGDDLLPAYPGIGHGTCGVGITWADNNMK